MIKALRTKIFIDSFDHDANEVKRLRGAELDKHVLKTAKKVSIFWITETLSRAKRVTEWKDSGILVLDHKSIEYPWLKIIKADFDDK